MTTQSDSICSHNIPRLSSSLLIPSRDGSAAAAAAHKSAAPIGARGVSDPGRRSSILICRILQYSDEIRVPPARRSRRPTVFPVTFRSAFCLHPMYFTVFRASEVLRIRILDASGPRSSKHYANYALWELRIRILDTSGPRSTINYANYVIRATHIDQPTS